MAIDILTDNEALAFAQRLNQALDMAEYPVTGNGRQRAVAGAFQVTPQAAQKWLDGRSLPKALRINVIAKELGVNSQWLISGQGSILPDAPAKNVNDLQATYYSPNAELNHALNKLPKTLQPTIRKHFIAMTKAILDYSNSRPDTADATPPKITD